MRTGSLSSGTMPWLVICISFMLLGGIVPGAAAQVVISEFMASNSRTLADENGEFSDWIEISNLGSDSVDLLNWCLTDEPFNLTKWRFPSITLPAGQFLVVFASSKDRRVPGQPLHTDFKLSNEGEYLALVMPDGTTIASEFKPVFPPQTMDVSYGLAATGTNLTLVPTGAVARALVPRDGTLGLGWTLPDFDDSSWAAGLTGVGYERLSGYGQFLGLDLLSTSLPPALRIDSDADGVSDNNSVYVRIPFVVSEPAALTMLNLRMRYDDGFAAYLNGNPVASHNAPMPLAWNSSSTGDYGDVTDVMMAIVYGPGNSITIYRNGQIYASAANTSTGTLQTYPANVADVLIGKRHEDLSDGGTAGGMDGFLAGSVNEARIYGRPLSAADILALYSFGPVNSTSSPPAVIATNLLHLWSFQDGTARDSMGTSHGTLLNGAFIQDGRLILDGVNDYMRSSPIRTNISERTLIVWVSLANLTQQAGSALTLENPTGSDVFDGIIFGERIPQQWMNGSSYFNRSTVDNGGARETVVETIASSYTTWDISEQLDKLVPGTNILAIHGLNFAARDSDMLIYPALLGGIFALQTTNFGFFDKPTPGGMNGESFEQLFAKVEFSHDHGVYTTPFTLSITSDLPGITLRYTTNGSVPSETNSQIYTGPLLINSSLVLRAAAFKAGLSPTKPQTRTYIFLDSVLQQKNLVLGGTMWDTEMDPQVVNNSNQTWTVAQGLVDLPVISVAMDEADLFGPNGIYANATARGDDWERAASVEMLYPADYTGPREGRGFNIDCGIQINGNYSRLAHQPKHSFRLLFKAKWGPTTLNFPVFPDYEVSSFDTLLVACGHNQGWSTGIANSQFLRNRFCWDMEGVTQGSAYVHSRSVHLYLNGVYWGVFDLNERPDETFSAENFGGAKEEYDALKGQHTSGTTLADLINGTRDVWVELFSRADRDLTVPAYYAAVLELVDIDQLIESSIGILYTADRDGPTGWINGPPNSLEPKNFYATRRRTPDGRFRFWRWDSEFTLESANEDVSERQGYENPARLHYNLRANADYRMRFADRVQQFFYNNGPYSVAALTNRYMALAREIDKAIVAESARWGDAKREPPFTRDVEWVSERDRIVKSYFPARMNIFLDQLRADRLFPSFSAPELKINGISQYGGDIIPGTVLTLVTTNGQIYYTLDGADPRLSGGAIAPNATLYSAAVVLNESCVVKARVYYGGQWSALSEATFFAPQDWSGLLISEIMYNPPPVGEVSGEEFEFIELKNAGTNMLALDSLTFTDGINFSFPRSTLLAPGHFCVLVRNAAQFQAKYPGVAVNGVYRGSLNNGGETIGLSHPTQGAIVKVTYGNSVPWPVTPDNLGFSLVPVYPNSNADPDDPRNWRASSAPGGSPGADDPPNLIPSVLINEVLTASPPPQVDMIELFNPTGSAADIGSWFLTDDPAFPKKFRIPENTLIGAGAFILFDETQFNADPNSTNSFALSSAGEKVFLFSADPFGNLTGYDHGFAFGAAQEDVPFGRYVISTGEEQFPPQVAFTPGTTNAGPLIGRVVMTEIHYHPAPGQDAFVEIQNISAAPVLLYDPAFLNNTWKINGLGYTFPTGMSLQPGEIAVISSIEPLVFRSKYSVPASVLVFGPYTGVLQHSGERLEVQMPAVPTTQGVPYITVDEVRYNDQAPWPHTADGYGPSLQRLGSGLYGNDPINWTAALPTPGNAYIGGTQPTIQINPTNAVVSLHSNAVFTVVAAGTAPLSYQWLFNESPLPGATNSTLIVTNAQPVNMGVYSVVVCNRAGAITSSGARIFLIGSLITQQPVDVSVAAGGIANFSVTASGQGTVGYQWFFEGAEIPGATNASLTLTNVQVAQSGPYAVLVSDAYGSELSQTALLGVASKPVIVVQPRGQTVLEGGTAVFSITVKGDLPMTYRWRRNGVTVVSITTNAMTSTFTVTNVQTANAGNYTVGVSNPLGAAPVSSTAVLTVLADFDRDGLPDQWEVLYGFNTNSAADALIDSDQDGASNAEEYLAGTDPTNPASSLRLQWLAGFDYPVLSFEAISNRSYSVHYTDGLPSTSWPLLTNFPPRLTNWNALIFDPPAKTRFYRLFLPPNGGQ